MSVKIGDPSRHRSPTRLVDQAFRSFAEDRAEEREVLGAIPEAATRESTPTEEARAKSSARRRA